MPIGNHRQHVPSVRFGGRDDAHLQDVDLKVPANSLPRTKRLSRRASRLVAAPAAVAGPTSAPSRPHWRGQLAVGRSEEETLRLRATCSRSGRVAPGCASSAEAPRRRGPAGHASRLTRSNPVSHPAHEPPFDLHGRASGGGGRTRTTRRARPRRPVQVRRGWNREPRGTSRTLLAQEPGDGGHP